MKKLEELGISPTPWKCATNDYGEVVGIENGRGFYVARFAVDVDQKSARLIAAAPDMYEALLDAEAKLDALEPYCNELEKIRAALAKASGESEVEK